MLSSFVSIPKVFGLYMAANPLQAYVALLATTRDTTHVKVQLFLLSKQTVEKAIVDTPTQVPAEAMASLIPLLMHDILGPSEPMVAFMFLDTVWSIANHNPSLIRHVFSRTIDFLPQLVKSPTRVVELGSSTFFCKRLLRLIHKSLSAAPSLIDPTSLFKCCLILLTRMETRAAVDHFPQVVHVIQQAMDDKAMVAAFQKLKVKVSLHALLHAATPALDRYTPTLHALP